jgi:hypothetical protein
MDINTNRAFPWDEADAMFVLLIRRAADLQDCGEGSPEQEELDCLTNAIDVYEAKRWPTRKGAVARR